MEKKELNPEYIAMRDMALEQLKSGKSLTGKGGVFTPIIKEFLESALEAEMDEHLTSERRSQGNKRNGKGNKTVRSEGGSVDIEPPYDRHGDFEPEIVKKRQTVLADSLAPKLLAFTARV